MSRSVSPWTSIFLRKNNAFSFEDEPRDEEISESCKSENHFVFARIFQRLLSLLMVSWSSDRTE